ncbi:MAG TPA: hypothetical protein VGP62_27110 [Bryobacteraceae bacterium]|jgi:hypothetical protein|nr:hypothetical protein [Bryobacteraceae bacterium]
MRINILWAIPGLLAPSLLAQSWSLPQGTTVKDNGPRTYRFTVEYNTANSKGATMRRQRLTGEYTRGLGGGEVMWKNVAEAVADGSTAPFAAPQKRDFMEGFRYPDDLSLTVKPDFFKGFPAMAVLERNLVWDTGMLEYFGQNFFDQLKLNEPYHTISNQDLKLPDIGTFHNRDVILEWIGRSRRNGRDCAVIQYQAFFNPLEVAVGGMSLKARSDYWGEIWVALDTKQIEYGTIYESVVGEMKPPGQDTVQFLNIFRSGSLEPLDAK